MTLELKRTGNSSARAIMKDGKVVAMISEYTNGRWRLFKEDGIRPFSEATFATPNAAFSWFKANNCLYRVD